MSETRVDGLLSFVEALDAERRPWDGLWDELGSVVHPRQSIINSKNSASTPDRTKLAESFDGTAMRANRTLAQGQSARITPMGARWFALRPPDELSSNPSAISWYQKCGEILARKFQASNFYNRIYEHYLDRGAFGTAATEILSGKGGKGLHFRAYSIGSYSVAQNELDEVDTIARTARLTPRQIIAMFPDSTPAEVRVKADDPKASLQPLEVVRLIRPRMDRDPRKSDAINKAFESIYILKADKVILSESGFDSFPIAVSRWELWGDSPYGWAPSYLALSEASQANFLEKMLDTLAETSAFPRVLYSSSLKGDIDFRALGLTCWDPSAGAEGMPREWLTQGRYDIGKDRSEDKRKAIEEAFFVPLFNAISQLRPDASATQVSAMVSESRELFHPILAGTNRELISPCVRRGFSLLLQQGELPPPPAAVLQKDSLGEFIADPAVELTSAMALALEQSQLGNFAECINVLAPLAQADPAAFDFLDTDVIGPAFFRYKGLPENFIRHPDAIAALREARAQAQQAQNAAQATSAVRNLGGAQGIQDLSALAGQ